jgi:hypothetical protein
MVALSPLVAFVVATALAGCGGAKSTPQLVDGSSASELPPQLEELHDAVLTRTSPVAAADVDELAACGFTPADDRTTVVQRVGVDASSVTFRGRGASLYACDKIVDPSTADDPDLPFGGLWCGGSVGRLDHGDLNDPRLDLCTNTDDEATAFAWVEPRMEAKWVVVSDGGTREVYEVAESLPVRVTSTENIGLGKASFAIEEYTADGSKVREYMLDAQVAG